MDASEVLNPLKGEKPPVTPHPPTVRWPLSARFPRPPPAPAGPSCLLVTRTGRPLLSAGPLCRLVQPGPVTSRMSDVCVSRSDIPSGGFSLVLRGPSFLSRVTSAPAEASLDSYSDCLSWAPSPHAESRTHGARASPQDLLGPMPVTPQCGHPCILPRQGGGVGR